MLFISTKSVDSHALCSFENFQIHKFHKFHKHKRVLCTLWNKVNFLKKVVSAPNLSVVLWLNDTSGDRSSSAKLANNMQVTRFSQWSGFWERGTAAFAILFQKFQNQTSSKLWKSNTQENWYVFLKKNTFNRCNFEKLV